MLDLRNWPIVCPVNSDFTSSNLRHSKSDWWFVFIRTSTVRLSRMTMPLTVAPLFPSLSFVHIAYMLRITNSISISMNNAMTIQTKRSKQRNGLPKSPNMCLFNRGLSTSNSVPFASPSSKTRIFISASCTMMTPAICWMLCAIDIFVRISTVNTMKTEQKNQCRFQFLRLRITFDSIGRCSSFDGL